MYKKFLIKRYSQLLNVTMKQHERTLPLTDPCCFGRVFLFMDVATPCRVVKIGFRVRKWNDHVISSGFVQRQPAWYTIRRCANIFFFSILFLFFIFLSFLFLLSLIFYIFFIAFVFSLFFLDLFFSSLVSFLLFSFWMLRQHHLLNIFSFYLHLFSFIQFSYLLFWNWTGHERNIFMGNDSFTEILVIAHQAQRHALNYFHECLTSYAIYSSVVVSSLNDCQYKALLFLIMTRTLDAR